MCYWNCSNPDSRDTVRSGVNAPGCKKSQKTEQTSRGAMISFSLLENAPGRSFLRFFERKAPWGEPTTREGVPENLVSREGFGSPVPRQPAHLHTQAESGASLRDSSRFPRWRPFLYLKPPYAIGSVPSLSGHRDAYRWRSLPRVRRHRASKS